MRSSLEKRLTVSSSSPGAFEPWSDEYDDLYDYGLDDEFSEAFAKASGVTTLFEWRVTYTNASGGSSVTA